MQEMTGLDGLRGHGRMIWIDAERGWVAAPDEIVITVDGESVTGDAASPQADSHPEHHEDGGEG